MARFPPTGDLENRRAGTLVLVYMDMSTYKWAWDAAKGEAAA